MKKQSNPKCDPCEQRFEDNVHNIVKEVEGYTPHERREKEREVEEAFPAAHPAQPASHSAHHPAAEPASHPTSKMPHGHDKH